jgi:aspartokinase/homoserine dehydrogenase 1
MIPRRVVHKFGGTSIADAKRARGKVLRYVGTIEAGETGETGEAGDAGGVACVAAGLREYPLDQPFANLSGSDNIVSFQTARCNTQPMIVRGPGAGAEVTAAGVFADLLRLASFLGAPL